MIALIGESAAGKSSIAYELSDKFGYKPIITYTTRMPRIGEIDGVDYHFVSREEFERLKHKWFFCETAEYNGWLYGTASEDCKDDTVIVITPHGLRQLKKNKDLKITSFYIKVPRRDRLIKILERGDDVEEAYRRNLSDVGQYDGVEDEVDFVIENNGYDNSSLELAYEIVKIMEDVSSNG